MSDLAESGPCVRNQTKESPFADLMADLLIIIFEQGHAGDDTSFSHLVSSICRHWRNVALDAPSLWSPIMFSDDDYPQPFKIASLYLERTKSYPVDMIVIANESLESFMEELIIPHLYHCRALSIEGCSDRLLTSTIRLGSMPTPILEELELISGCCVERDDEALASWRSRSQLILFNTHTIRTLHVEMIPLDWSEPALLFRLEHVTNFTLKWNFREPHFGRTVHQKLNGVIEAMPELLSLKLYCTELAGPSPPLLLIKLPRTLRILDLTDILISWPLEPGGPLKYIFPYLETLHLAFSSPRKIIDAGFFTRLSLLPRLKELCMTHVELFYDYLEIRTPIRLPYLTHLTLNCWGPKTIQSFIGNVSTPELISVIFTVSHPFTAILHSNQDDPVIPTLWASCPRLVHMVISHGCTLARNCDLLGALQILKDVKSLDLRGQLNGQWGDELLMGMGASPWACRSLEEISFSYMPTLTQEAVEFFVTARLRGYETGQCAAIKAIRMRGCSNLNSTSTLEGMVDEVLHWI